jgi:hypothetical protein
MAVLYQVDFTTLPNQTIGAAGSYTVDGKTVWAKGTLAPAGSVLQTNIKNGLGLHYEVLSGSGSLSIGTSGELLQRHFFWPLSQFSGWTSGKAYMVRFRMSATIPQNVNPYFGLVDSTSDAVNLQAAQRAGDLLVAPTPSSGTVGTLAVKLGAAAATTATGRATAMVNSECIVGVYHFTPRFAYLGSERLVSGMPTDPASWLAITSVAVLDYNGLRTNPGVFFSMGTSVFSGAYLQQMRIETIGDLSDTTLPTATLVSPSSLTRLTRVQPVVFSVQDETDLKRVHVWIKFASGETEVVYAEGQFQRGYAGYSTQSGTNPKVLTVRRDFGWPSPMTGEFHFDPVDSGGNSSV